MIIGVYIHLFSFVPCREDLRNLDSEIELFLGESWKEEEDLKTGKGQIP